VQDTLLGECQCRLSPAEHEAWRVDGAGHRSLDVDDGVGSVEEARFSCLEEPADLLSTRQLPNETENAGRY